jgi:signal transduction histidine kinase
LLLSLMLIVLVITGATSYVAERNAHTRYQEGLDGQFQDQMRLFTALQDARRTAILERCRAISHSVRLRAALEEEDVEDLYRNAFSELQGIYNPGAAGGEKADPQIPRAMFFRFLDAHGGVLSPDQFRAGYTDQESLGEALAPMGRALPDFREQTVGYLALNRHNDLTAVCEVVVTKIIGWEGEQLGALVLGFPVHDVVAPDTAQSNTIASGIWLSQRLYTNTKMNAADRHLMASRIGARIAHGSGHFPAELGNAPYLLFYKALDPNTQLEPAYEVCFYPLAASLRQQQALRWKIAGLGGLVLLAGFIASLFLAKGLSKPVDEIVAGSVQNLTLRRQAERDLLEANRELEKTLQELRATQQQIIQHERLRALGQMASGVAHDFNNTLTPILGFADLLLERENLLDDKPQTTRFLKLLRTSALDAANVVRRLREFYRPLDQNEELAAVDLSDLVAQVVSLTEPKWRQQAQANGATIRIKKKLELLRPVAANESALREALTNIIFNAVDAMPTGGVICLETGTENEQAVVRVKDNGSGMTEAVRRRCLEPFFSTKGEHGTGLGLAMVYGIIERHRGRLEIESTPGEGTTFIIQLPFAEPVAAEAIVPEAPEIAKPALNVLVVDDEPGIRELIAAFLRSDGHGVTTACNGREGLAEFRSHPFDIVVTDRAMPEMNGDQMAGLMKQAHPEVPVVLLTGFGAQIQATGVQPPSVDVVLNKPVTLKTLLSTIENLRHAA